jgi:membrane-associated phospholipid phosphatase
VSRGARRGLAAVGTLLLATPVWGQQQPAPTLERRQPVAPSARAPALRARDAWRVGAWLAATAVALPLDARIDRWSARPSVQDNQTLRALADAGDITGTYAALGVGPVLWALGAARHDSTLRGVGTRTSAAVALAFVSTGAIKVLAGRARPYATDNDSGDWNAFRGLRTDSLRSFSSAHTALATAAAVTLASEWRRRGARRGWQRAGPPALYALAAIAGGSRIRDRQHWASDVMMGAAVGTASALVVRRWSDHRAGRR